jgi:4-hydroxyproline epimerase
MNQEIQVVDSHTAGEPTRVVIAGGPDLGSGKIKQRLERFRKQFDSYRSAIVNEPRGSDVLVGALLCEPSDPTCLAGVIFFNNVGFLGMCGHGLIGVIETLKYLGRFTTGVCTIETPVGVVTAEALDDGSVRIANVESYRVASDVKVETDGLGTVVGDVAWGGNWFFLVERTNERIALDNVDRLSQITKRIEQALADQGITGANGERIDHVELYGSGAALGADSQNFVLCPGGSYDRSPCGTGTSAKLACLAADGRLKPGQLWRQASVVGGVFEASYQPGQDGTVIPTITGRAFVSGTGRLILQADDPYRFGIRA